jgi:hypothetical protein
MNDWYPGRKTQARQSGYDGRGMRERKSVRGTNWDSGTGHGKSSRPFRGARALEAGNVCRRSDQMNAAEMDKALDARRGLARICAMDRRHSPVVTGMRALRLSGAAPGH